MNDVLVSIRMPRSLAMELRQMAKPGHFMDVSEEIRSIVRQKWMQALHPELMELGKLREDIRRGLERKGQRVTQRYVVAELEKIRKQLLEEDAGGGSHG